MKQTVKMLCVASALAVLHTAPAFSQTSSVSLRESQVLSQAFRLLDNGHYQTATKLAAPFLRHDATCALANLLIGTANMRTGKKESALPYLQKAFELNERLPGAAEAYFDALIANNEFEKSLHPGLVMLAMENPRDGRAQFVRRKLRLVLHHFDNATLKSEIDQVASNLFEGRSQCSFYLILAHLCDRIGKRTLAISLYIHGLAMRPENPGEYVRFARDLEFMKASPSVINQQYRKALSMAPYDLSILSAYKRYHLREIARPHDIARSIKDAVNSKRYQ